MADSLILIGGAINASSVNAAAINGIVRADYIVNAGGHITATGSAAAHSDHYWYPDGVLVAAGFTVPAYGQLAVLGGYTTVADVSTACCWGHLYTPVGGMVADGSADAYPMYAVQKMWSARTVLVPSDNYRVLSILPYANLAEVVQTEVRVVDVPAIDTYYIEGI